MHCSTPSFPVLHYLPEFAQTHVHWVGDAIQPSHPLLPSSPFALNLSSDTGKDWNTGYSPKNCGITLFWMRGQSLTAHRREVFVLRQTQVVLTEPSDSWRCQTAHHLIKGLTLKLVLVRDTHTEWRVAFYKEHWQVDIPYGRWSVWLVGTGGSARNHISQGRHEEIKNTSSGTLVIVGTGDWLWWPSFSLWELL